MLYVIYAVLRLCIMVCIMFVPHVERTTSAVILKVLGALRVGASWFSLFPKIVLVRMCSFVCYSNLPQAVDYMFVLCVQN
jgi:hypothetical protein